MSIIKYSKFVISRSHAKYVFTFLPAEQRVYLENPSPFSGNVQTFSVLEYSIYRTSSNVFKLKKGIFRLDIRNKFFTLRVVRPWHRLPREAVAAPSLAVFQARLDGALSNLVW